VIVDGDGHFVEPPDLWRQYVPKRWQDRVYIQYATNGQTERLIIGDFVLDSATGEGFSQADSMNPGGLRHGQPRGRPFEEAAAGGLDPRDRLKVHDTEGIDAAVLFPSIGLLLSHLPDPDIAVVACEAVNRWSSAYCSVAPAELYAVALLPMTDPELAAKELRRAVKDGHVAGFLRPNPTPTGRLIDDPVYETLWSTAVELGVPLCFHNAADQLSTTNAGANRAKSFFLRHAAGHSMEAMLAFGSLFQSRVFDRYRELRIGFMEAGCGWAPFWLERLDEHTDVIAGLFDPPLTRLPSEVFREQCIVGCEGDERMVPYVQAEFGLDAVI
jgi:predicted TIM-barrel fold metal-dependent hydrolase